MKRKTTICSILALMISLASCQTEPVEINAGTETDGNAVESDACEPGVMRLQLTEEVADGLILSASANGGFVRVSDIPEEIAAMNVVSLKPCFHIGGKYEKMQRKHGLHRWFEAGLAEETPVTRAVSAAGKSGGCVVSAEPVYKVREMSVTMNDPYYASHQWHYNNTGQFGFRQGIDMGLQRAWDKYGVFGSSDVIVAVLDSGVDFDHPDLKPNAWTNESEIPGNGRDDDGNGYVDDIHGYNFVTGNAAIHPVDHGTHVAGTVAAANNNGIGVCGVAGGRYPDIPGVRIMGVQMIDPTVNKGADMLKAFQYAAENGAVIAQNSWGYDERQHVTTLPPAVKQGIDYFIEVAGCDPDGNQIGPMKGGLVIFAAGNDAVTMALPAAYEKVISVAAIGPYGSLAYYSNYGDWVTVCAPGGDQTFPDGGVYSTMPDGSYGGYQGTSMACPHVSGIAALLLSAAGGPDYTNRDLWDAVVRATDESIYEFNPGYIGKLGKGMVDAELALSTLNREAPQPVTDFGLSTLSNSIECELAVPSDDGGTARAGYINVYYSRAEFTAATLNRATRVQFRVADLESAGEGRVSLALKHLEFETGYYCALTASDFARNESELSEVRHVTTGRNSSPSVRSLSGNNLTVRSWDNLNVQFEATDPDGHDVTIFIDNLESSMQFSYGNGIGTLIIHGAEAAEGKHTVPVSVVDEYGAMGSMQFSFTVLTNTAPELVMDVPSLAVNGPGASSGIVISDYFSDADAEPLFATVELTDRSIVSFSYAEGIAYFTGSKTGSTRARLVVSDARGASASSEFTIVVRDASAPMDIYPNPATDFVNVRTGEDVVASVKIYSASGAVAWSAADVSVSLNSPLKIDLSDIAPGVYTLALETAKGTYKSKFSKK